MIKHILIYDKFSIADKISVFFGNAEGTVYIGTAFGEILKIEQKEDIVILHDTSVKSF